MTYFVWQRNHALVGKYAHFDDEPETYDEADWGSGVKSKKKLPELTLVADERYESKLTDQLLTRFELQVFSQKLRAALADAGVKNLDYYPAKVVDHDGEVIGDGYQTANLIGLIACLDEKKSQCTHIAGKLADIEKFKVHESKIVATPDMRGDALIFRLAELPAIVLVHESVKKLVEKAGITGVKFTPPEKYIGA